MRSFAEQDDVQIGEKTTKLLLDAVSYIDQLVSKSTEIHLPNEDDADFLKQLDQRNYELRQNIMCRQCIVSVTFILSFFK